MTLENIFYFINKIETIKQDDVKIFTLRLKEVNKNIKVTNNNGYLIIYHNLSGYSPKLIKII